MPAMLRSFVARRGLAVLAGLAWPLLLVAAVVAAQPAFIVVPAEANLHGNFARLQLLAVRPVGDGALSERSEDLTTQAKYQSSDAAVVTVSAPGQLLAVANGQATITVT